MSDRSYNPLNVDELGRNAARKLMDYPAVALPPEERFAGGGVYSIYYHGGFLAYAKLKGAPIYVGKADLPGKRQGRRAGKAPRPVLHSRLREHAQTIRHADNLSLSDFRCRWLVLDPVWISLTEQVLIAEYQPVWNVLVDGFGIHQPGRGRHRQRRSQWDTLHPGRPRAADLPDNDMSAAEIEQAILNRRNAP